MMNFQQFSLQRGRERAKAKSFRQVNIDCIFFGLGAGGANFSLSRSFVDALEVGGAVCIFSLFFYHWLRRS